MGLEVVVRPVVLPNIRPSAAARIAPPDDPTKGLCVMTGGGGKFIGQSASQSISISKQKPHEETKRQVDVERVHQMDDQGNINKDNFIDVERLRRVQLKDSSGDIANRSYAEPVEAGNIASLRKGVTIIRKPADDG